MAEWMPDSLSNTRSMALMAVRMGRAEVRKKRTGALVYREGTYEPRDQSGYQWLADGAYIEATLTQHWQPVRLTERGEALYAHVSRQAQPTASSRTYTVHVPVDVRVQDDGTVRYDVDRLAAAQEVASQSEDHLGRPVPEEQVGADTMRVEADAQAWQRIAARLQGQA